MKKQELLDQCFQKGYQGKTCSGFNRICDDGEVTAEEQEGAWWAGINKKKAEQRGNKK